MEWNLERLLSKSCTEWGELVKESEKDWLEELENQEHLCIMALVKEALNLTMKGLCVNNYSGNAEVGTRSQRVEKEVERGVKKIQFTHLRHPLLFGQIFKIPKYGRIKLNNFDGQLTSIRFYWELYDKLSLFGPIDFETHNLHRGLSSSL